MEVFRDVTLILDGITMVDVAIDPSQIIVEQTWSFISSTESRLNIIKKKPIPTV